MSERFDQVLDELCKELGLDDAKGLASPVELVIDELPVTLASDHRASGDDLLMYASLGTVPERRELEVYRAILEGNLLWSATGDATIGVNSATREALIAYRMPLDGLNGEGLARMAGHFVEIAANWRDFVKASGEEEAMSAQSFMDTMTLRV